MLVLAAAAARGDVIGIGIIDADAPGPPIAAGAYVHPNWIWWPRAVDDGSNRLLSPATGLDWLPMSEPLEVEAGRLKNASELAHRGFYRARSAVFGDRVMVCEVMPGVQPDPWSSAMASNPDGSLTTVAPGRLSGDTVAFFRARDWSEGYRLVSGCDRAMVIEYKEGQGSRSRVWLMGKWPGGVASPGPIPGLIEARQAGSILADPEDARWLQLDARQHGFQSYLDGLRVQRQTLLTISILVAAVSGFALLAVARGKVRGWHRLAIEAVAAILIGWHGMGPSISRQGDVALVAGGWALLLGLSLTVFGVGKLLAGLQWVGGFRLQAMFGFALVGAAFGWMSAMGWSAFEGAGLYAVAIVLWRRSGQKWMDCLSLLTMAAGFAIFLAALRTSGASLDLGFVGLRGAPRLIHNADEAVWPDLATVLAYPALWFAGASISLLVRQLKGFLADRLRHAQARVVRIPMLWLWIGLLCLLPFGQVVIVFALLWLAVLRDACRVEGA